MLLEEDLQWCLRCIPRYLLTVFEQNEDSCVLAGGFIRSTLSQEKANDIDLFTVNIKKAEEIAHVIAKIGAAEENFTKQGGLPITRTENAFTIMGKIPIQIIHRWTFSTPADVVESFDFTISRAAIWYKNGTWNSLCDDRFYQDLACKRLIYTNPTATLDVVGATLLRVIKFCNRGYRISPYDLGCIVARIGVTIYKDNANLITSAPQSADELYKKIVIEVLREIDPRVAI